MKKFSKFVALLGLVIITSVSLFSQVYKVNPDVSTCRPGQLTDAEKQKVLERVNYIRSIHKLKPVSWETAGDAMSMEGCLNIVASGQSGHVDDPSSECYTPGGGAARMKSNLFAGSSSGSIDYTSIDIIVGWMIDDHNADQANEHKVGHRRAIINPFLTKFAFGRAEGTPKGGGGNMVAANFLYQEYTNGNISDTDLEYIAYPFEYYPPSFFNKQFYLSFNAIASKSSLWDNQNVSYAQTNVTMTDENGNNVAVSEIKNDNEGWGSFPNNLSWKAANLVNEVKYTVKITNVNVKGQMKDYEYWFKLTDKNQTTPPKAPTLAAPVNKSENVSLTQALAWKLTDNTNSYNLQVSENTSFTGLVINKTSINASGYAPSANELDFNTTYYWRVASKNDAGVGAWSEVWSFTTGDKAPNAPTLAAPVNNATSVSVAPLLSWYNVINASTYQIQISKTDVFSGSDIIYSKSAIATNSFNVPKDRLSPNTKYYWRARASTAGGDSPYSEFWTFTTSDELPKLLGQLPEDKTEEVALTPLFKWDFSQSANSFNLQIATDETFSNIVYNNNKITNNNFFLDDYTLESGVWFFWRVNMTTPQGVSPWSDVLSFKTVGGGSVEYMSDYNQFTIAVPNPAYDITTIKFILSDAELINIKIFNLNGTLVKSIEHFNANIGENRIAVSLNGFSSGVYYYQLHTKNSVYTNKIEVVR